eukprot:g12939.t1
MGDPCPSTVLVHLHSGTLMGDPAIMVNIYPSFPEKPSQFSAAEFIFLMDRSGSMGCKMSENYSHVGPTRIQSAKVCRDNK